ncbi:hypothetical protein RRG08_022290 [Elysia crispata]|uniref:Uncharacterized protein n=1 Tax=Elysia crispata TaxID=231223 RepID=A0AAE1DK43_9GAST|nr:hypothetical protein RRG08_022290 [Elysia crispata]
MASDSQQCCFRPMGSCQDTQSTNLFRGAPPPVGSMRASVACLNAVCAGIGVDSSRALLPQTANLTRQNGRNSFIEWTPNQKHVRRKE